MPGEDNICQDRLGTNTRKTWRMKRSFSRRRLAKEFDQEGMQETERALNVMKSIPHVLPFERRVLLFRQWVEEDRARAGAVRTQITIRRTHVIEDALAELGAENDTAASVFCHFACVCPEPVLGK